MNEHARKFPEQTTVEEFLALPGCERCELVDGAITSMAPATPIHGRLQAQIGEADTFTLPVSACR